MRIVIDTPHVESRLRLARSLSLGGLVVLGAGFLISSFGVGYVSSLGIDPFLASWSLLLIGLVVSQVALYFGNRYGARYRPDQVMDSALRGLDDRYVIFHHVKGLPPHVLLSPSGAWALEAKHQSGLVRWIDGRWRHDMPLKFLRSLFGEGLGNLARDARYAEDDLKKSLARAEVTGLPTHVVLVFTDPNVKVDAEGAPIAAVQVLRLKELLRRVDRETAETVSRTTINQAAQSLGRGLPEAESGAADEPAEAAAAPARRTAGATRKRRRARDKGKGA